MNITDLIEKCQPDPITRYFKTAIPKGLTVEQMAEELNMHPVTVYGALYRNGLLDAYIAVQGAKSW
jgi:AraC-like DNA-binding protein